MILSTLGSIQNMRAFFFSRSAGLRLLALPFFFSIAFLAFQLQGDDTDKILFLHLKIKDGVVTLVKSSVVPGTLKAQRNPDKKAAFQFAAENSKDEALWTDSMEDPSVERIEYPDPDAPGGIQSKFIQRNEAEFTVPNLLTH